MNTEELEKVIEKILQEEIDHNMGSNGKATERFMQFILQREEKILLHERERIKNWVEENSFSGMCETDDEDYDVVDAEHLIKFLDESQEEKV